MAVWQHSLCQSGDAGCTETHIMWQAVLQGLPATWLFRLVAYRVWEVGYSCSWGM